MDVGGCRVSVLGYLLESDQSNKMCSYHGCLAAEEYMKSICTL